MPPHTNSTALSKAPIAQLPAELIERILLHVVNEEALPTEAPEGFYEDHALTNRRHQGSVSQLLSFRLTSKTLRDMSWRALAEVLGATTFDLQSTTSMANLEALSSCAILSPWITKINITCSPLFNPSKDPVACPMFHTGNDEDLIPQWHNVKATSPGLRKLQETLARRLVCFKNLESASFIFDESKVPKRYQDIFDDNTFLTLRAAYHGVVIHPWRAHAQVSQQIFLHALAACKARPRSLQLAPNFTGLHSFVTGTTDTELVDIYKNVQKLSLTHWSSATGALGSDSSSDPEILVTKDVFPNLRCLTISSPETLPGTVSLSAELIPPMLSTLTILICTLPHANFFPQFRNKVQHLELQILVDGPNQETFQAIAALKLKTLTLVWMNAEFFEDEGPDTLVDCYDWLATCKGISIFSAAVIVIIRPEIVFQMFKQQLTAAEIE